jgi:Zn-dependent protease/CBS domain-containing protein
VSLGVGLIPTWHPSWSATLAWTVALLGSLLFLVSVVLHELAHCAAARHCGIPVRSITLFLFGGLAALEDDPESPKQEALIAGVGPLSSLGFGAVLLFLASLLVKPEGALLPLRFGPLATVLAWLGSVNVFIGAFNLLPAYPLDGGRVLRGALWAVTKDLLRATRWATRVGQLLGCVLMLAGAMLAFGRVLPIVGSGVTAGLWLALIGWFIHGAAVASYNDLIAKQALRGVAVATLMRRHLPTPICHRSSIEVWIAEHVLATGTDKFPVADAAGRVIGIASIEAAKSISRQAWPTTPVIEVTDRFAGQASASVGDDAFVALRRLERQPGARDLPVLDDGKLVGLFGSSEVMRWLDLRGAVKPLRGTLGHDYATRSGEVIGR